MKAVTKAQPESPAVAPTDTEMPKGLLKLIFLHELQDQLTSMRFYLSLLLVILLMVLGAVVYSIKYRSEVGEYGNAITQYEQQLSGKSIRRLMSIPHPAVKSPWMLAFLADSGQTMTPNYYGQGLNRFVGYDLNNTRSLNYRLRPLQAIDWLFIIRVVLSLMAFVITYDAICGEKERGTLRLLMSYSISRWLVLTGKFLAAWVCVVVPFLVGALLNLIILTSYGGIKLSGRDIGEIVAVCLLTFLACAFFVFLALLVSALTHRTTSSLVILLLAWVAFVVAIPGASATLARNVNPIPTPETFARQRQAIAKEIEQEYANRPHSSWRGRQLGKKDNYAWEHVAAEAQNKQFAREEGLFLDGLRQKFRQTSLARTLSLISPMSLFQYTGERVVGGGLDRDRRFIEQSRAFRGVLEDYFRAVDENDPKSPHIYFWTDYMSDQKADVGSIPKFQFQEDPPMKGLRSGLWGLLVLALGTSIAAFAAYFVFLRFDVR